ncbi:MAG: sigma-70 family RNA polymerase sigma factor [Fibrella sp.]|nr:sigma-70 family RNA polymerase sigma factor [Armatimonadota bacterium]
MISTDTEPYRKGLQAHCYRMLGSAHEAEDAVQETMVRAWKSLDRFEARASLRNWLYRIATNVGLSRLARRGVPRRAVPERTGPPATQPPEGEPPPDLLWLEPYPDTLLETVPDAAPGPHARYEMREATQLAFVAAIQYLPPRQRAILLLCDALGWSAAEAAGTLDTSVASVNSALQRARDTLRRKTPTLTSPSLPDRQQRLLLDRYVRAWESHNLEGFVALLTEDAVFRMPPRPEWYRGRGAIRELLAWAWEKTGYSEFHLVPTRSNGQPAFALYGRHREGSPWQAHAIHVLDLQDGKVGTVTHFMDPAMFALFGLPPVRETA